MKYQNPFGTTGSNVPYINGNPATGVEGSIIPALAIQEPQTEIVNALTAKGLIPTDADITQLAQSIGYWIGTFGGTANALSTTLNPLPVSIQSGLIVAGLASSAAPNTGPMTLNVGVGGTIAVTFVDSAAFLGGEIEAPGQLIAFQYDGTAWRMISPLASTSFVKSLPASLNNVYVAPTGSDVTGTGTAINPWATIAHAITVVSAFQSSNGVTINVAAGTYTGSSGQIIANFFGSQIASWNLIGAGASSTFLNASALGGRGIVAYSSRVFVTGFTISAYYECAAAQAQGNLTVQNCNFLGGGVLNNCITSYYGSITNIYGAIGIGAGTYNTIFDASPGAMQIAYLDVNTTISTTITFAAGVTVNEVAVASSSGSMTFISGEVFWAGSTPTGTRFAAVSYGSIEVSGAGPNFIPGTIAGFVGGYGTGQSGGFYG